MIEQEIGNFYPTPILHPKFGRPKLYGFDAISAHNGWAMALAGALIVLSGLAVLSFVISQLHKVVALLEKRDEKPAEKPPAAKKPPKPAAAPQKPVLDVDAFKEKYQILIVSFYRILATNFEKIKV